MLYTFLLSPMWLCALPCSSHPFLFKYRVGNKYKLHSSSSTEFYSPLSDECLLLGGLMVSTGKAS